MLTRSEATALLALPCIKVVNGGIKAFVASSFFTDLVSSVTGVEIVHVMFVVILVYYFPTEQTE